MPLVAETDDESADFGRGALVDAVVALSKTPEDSQAYAGFAKRVEELRPLFNRAVSRDAELRLSISAYRVLQSGFREKQDTQMQLFAATVWPVVLDIPLRDSESAKSYIQRLCRSELALACNHIVPDYWPVVINSRVWRKLKGQVNIAYNRCRWCSDDPSFVEILSTTKRSHRRIELLAQNAHETGHVNSWARAGSHATFLEDQTVLSFERGGRVTINGEPTPGQDWRDAIARTRQDRGLAVHFIPELSIHAARKILVDIRQAGYQEVAIICRLSSFPYSAMQHSLSTSAGHLAELGVQGDDTIQVLVQNLDVRDTLANR